ncbi:MAG: Druantia anti-phage system protein DruA [Syntrophobacteraceae bacterium]
MEEPFTPIACSEEEIRQLEALAASRTAGIWRIKRAKIILGTLAGKNVERLVKETRVPPRSIARCLQDFARQRMLLFKVPQRGPTPREASVERILAFLEQPPPPTDPEWDSLKHRYIGIHFSARQIQTIRRLMLSNPSSTKAEVARKVCTLFGLFQPNGQYRSATLADILRRMEMDNLVTFLQRDGRIRRNAGPKAMIPRSPMPEQRELRPDEIGDLRFVPVITREQADLWNRLIQQYHYIATFKLFGPRIRYLVYGCLRSSHSALQNGDAVERLLSVFENDNDNLPDDLPRDAFLVAVLGYAASAWRVSSRDAFIGWTDEQRMANLRYVVSNSRFLILPWIRCRNLASRILSGAARQLPGDWEARYHYRPVLLETFVQLDRFTGTCYKAANWVQLGKTSGYSLYDRAAKESVPTKALFVYPLSKRFREVLCRAAQP